MMNRQIKVLAFDADDTLVSVHLTLIFFNRRSYYEVLNSKKGSDYFIILYLYMIVHVGVVAVLLHELILRLYSFSVVLVTDCISKDHL